MTEADNIVNRSGPSYVTKAVQLLPGGASLIATSRRHRKGRGPKILETDGSRRTLPGGRNPWFRFWAPHKLTWWVAVLFIFGSALFSLGGYVITFPKGLPHSLSDKLFIDQVFFIGSIFFTGAAFCQLLESINAGESAGLFQEETLTTDFQWIAWHPQRIGYMASLVQFIGTIMFNFNTGNAFISDLTWVQENILIWTPNIFGCICFLIASRLAFMEVCHGYWGWKPVSVEWWITVLNLLGSIGFMVSALYSLAVPTGDSSETFTWLSALFTFQGGVCFLIASYLLLPEMFSE